MNVTFQGFLLEEGDGITLSEFTGLLAAQSDVEKTYEFNKHFRIFLFESVSDPEFHTGLLVTTKDQKSFCELRKVKGKYKIKVSELEKGSHLMDFNFFVINKKTHAGMYQHYHQSCSPLQFCGFLRSNFWRPERDARCAAKQNYLTLSGMHPEKAERKAARDFRRLLKFDLLYKPDGFRLLLNAMQEIRGFEFNISTKIPKHDPFVPQGCEIKKETRKVIFANKTLVKKISNSVADFAEKVGLKKGKVMAVDAFGIDRAIYLEDNIASFGEFDFDAVTAEIELDLDNFAGSWVTKKLLDAARANKALFCEL